MSSRPPAARAAAFAARLVDRAAWYSGGIAERSRLAVRTTIARAGLPVTREYLELGCATGNEASGLFSEFTAVLGCLHHYQHHRDIYCGMRVDFGAEGLYYDVARGRNWWEYFFEPVALGDAAEGRRRRVPLWQHDAFAEGVEASLSREDAAAVIYNHVRPRRVVLDEVDRLVAAQFSGAHVIGVHYRGTDKYEESAPVDLPRMIDAIQGAVALTPQPWKIFVATDDQPALDALVAAFPGRVVAADSERSSDGSPVHKRSGEGFRRGLEACVDCFVLSRCAHLVRTSSNLGLVATYLNSAMPVTLVKARS